MIEQRVKAYAKINFGLRIFPKREDGFHNLEGIFQTIDLYDELIVSDSDKAGCFVKCKTMKLPAQNTLTVAYDAFCQVVGNRVSVPGVNVEVIKGIPAGGGLGGGSADAAALVRALEKRCKIVLTWAEKDFIAGKTGSDVFFFVHTDNEGKGCAKVSGRGEIIEPIKPRNDLYLVLIFPKENSITKTAYSLLDENIAKINSVKYPEYSELEGIYNTSVQDWSFKNSFTPVLLDSIKEIPLALEDLQNYKCCYSEVSGSGSTVFGVFTDIQQAEAVSNLLAEKWTCKLTKIL